MKNTLKDWGKGLLWSTRSISLSADAMLIGFLTFFCTDTLGLNIGIIGTLLLVAKIVDAITNFIFAYIVDNFHFKSGKGRLKIPGVITPPVRTKGTTIPEWREPRFQNWKPLFRSLGTNSL